MGLTAFIFARGGSKGLPGKNIRPLAGKPLIGWSIEQALASRHITRVIVSTDSPDIAKVARQFGAQVPFLRPAELASDTAPEMLAWQHALREVQQSEGAMGDPFISVPATAPLRKTEDIDACIDTYFATKVDVVLTVTDAHRSPWFNMVKPLDTAPSSPLVGLVNLDPQGNRVTRRQDAPVVYDVTTVAYAVSPAYVLAHTNLFEGRVAAAHVPVARSLDIDTLHDFELAEYLMQKSLAHKVETPR